MEHEKTKRILKYMRQIKRKYNLKKGKGVNPYIEKGYESLKHPSFPRDVDIAMGIRPDGLVYLNIGSQFIEYCSCTWDWNDKQESMVKKVIDNKIGSFMRLQNKKRYSNYI